jgi:hypothetical protein
MRKTAVFLFLCAIWIILAACRPEIKISPLPASDLTQVQGYSEPMVDNLMQALQGRNYELFSKNFNPTMHDVLAKPNFEEMVKTFDERIGTCTSRKFNQGVIMNDNYALTYDLACQKDTGVQMQVLFEPDEPHLIAGVFFTSPKLNQ